MDSGHNTASKKRKFNPAHEEAFLVTETPVGSICLLCDSVFSDNRHSNFKRHFDKFHSDFDESFPVNSQSRKKEINLLKSNSRKLVSLQSPGVINSDVDVSTIISYRVANLLIKSGKPFTDGELIKNAFSILSEELFKETEEKSKLENFINNISLSARTVVRRLESMNTNLIEQLTEDIKRCAYFSLQLDESMDVTDTSHVNVFIRLVFEDMTVKEELFDTLSLKENTRRLDVHTSLKNSLIKHTVPLQKLTAITTNGLAATVGQEMGFASLCKQDADFPRFASFQCLIHQVSLSAKAVEMSHVVTVVVKIVNLMKAKPQHRLFMKLLQEETELKFADITLHSDVRWLSLGKILHRFLEMLPQIKEFLNSKNESYQQLEDPKWILDLNFLVDLTNELNALNLSLQGKDQEAWRLLTYIDTFKYKLTLWISYFQQNKVFSASFPNLQKCVQNFEDAIMFSAEDFVKYLQTISHNFETRFGDWNDVRAFTDFLCNMLDLQKIDLQQISQGAHNFDPSIDRVLLTNEILNLQTDVQIRTCVNINSNLNIWNLVKESEYPTLLSLYKRMLSIFGSTYLCESSFATMKHIKSRYRSQMNDEHLAQVMRLYASTYEPEISKLV